MAQTQTTQASDVMLTLDMDDIFVDESMNLRRYPAGAGSIEDLALSIRDRGQLQPVLVAPTVNGDSQPAAVQQPYTLVAGFRRFKAIQMLNEGGGKSVRPVLARLVDGGSSLNSMLNNLAENVKRENLSPIDMAAAIKILREQGEMTVKDVAKEFKKSEAWVRQVEPLLTLSPDKQKAVHRGDIAFGVARKLTGLTEDEQDVVLKRVREAEEVGESGQTAAESARGRIRKQKGGRKAKSESGKTGLSAKGMVRACKEAVDEIKGQEKTTKAEDRAVEVFGLVVKVMTGKLGAQAFQRKMREVVV